MTVIFDPYRIDTWLDVNGLTVSVPVTTFKRPDATKPGKMGNIIKAAVFAVGLTITSLPFVADGVAIGGQIRLESTAEHAGFYARDDVAQGHWTKLLTLVRTSPQLPADNMTDDPPPIV